LFICFDSIEVKFKSFSVTRRIRTNYDKIDFNPEEASESVGGVIDDTKHKTDEVAKKASNKIEEAVENLSNETINLIIAAIDNLLTKVPTKDKSGPIIAESIFNFLCLILLLSITDKFKKFIYIPIFILLLISFLLNISSFFITYSFFFLVFNVIDIPGIGVNSIGSIIYLSCTYLHLAFKQLDISVSSKCQFSSSPPRIIHEFVF